MSKTDEMIPVEYQAIAADFALHRQNCTQIRDFSDILITKIKDRIMLLPMHTSTAEIVGMAILDGFFVVLDVCCVWLFFCPLPTLFLKILTFLTVLIMISLTIMMTFAIIELPFLNHYGFIALNQRGILYRNSFRKPRYMPWVLVERIVEYHEDYDWIYCYIGEWRRIKFCYNYCDHNNVPTFALFAELFHQMRGNLEGH